MSIYTQSDGTNLLTRLVEEEGEREIMEDLGLGTTSPFSEEEIAQDVDEAIARIAVRRREYSGDRAVLWVERAASHTRRWLLATLEAIGAYGQIETPALSGVRKKTTYHDGTISDDEFLLDDRADPSDWIPVHILCKENYKYFLTLRLNGNQLSNWPEVKLLINGRRVDSFQKYEEDRGDDKYLEVRFDLLNNELILRKDLLCHIGVEDSGVIFILLYNDAIVAFDDGERKDLPSYGGLDSADKYTASDE